MKGEGMLVGNFECNPFHMGAPPPPPFPGGIHVHDDLNTGTFQRSGTRMSEQ